MSMAAAIESRTMDVPASPNRLVSIDIVHDLSAAETIWRGLEGQQQSSTPYQRFDFLAAWQREVGEREGYQPFIVIAYNAELRPLLLLPLTLNVRHGIRTVSFMGGKHVTFNMGLWDTDFAASVTSEDLDTLMSALACSRKADILALSRQPERWRDLPNPIAKLRHQPSANDCPLMAIAPGAAQETLISNSFRRRLKGKERKLQALTGYRYLLATEDADIRRLLDWFFQVKPIRMAEQKLPNVFADPGVEEFIRSACMASLPNGSRAIDIHSLECDDEIIAIFAGVADGYRYSMLFNTYTMSGNSRYSPGLILMRNIIDYYAKSGYRALDLGIGSDEYKRLFCKGDEPIFDSFLPLSSRGRVAAAAMSAFTSAKHLVKHNQALFSVVQRLRGAFH